MEYVKPLNTEENKAIGTIPLNAPSRSSLEELERDLEKLQKPKHASKPVASNTKEAKMNALLARVQAAQERAKKAKEEKEKKEMLEKENQHKEKDNVATLDSTFDAAIAFADPPAYVNQTDNVEPPTYIAPPDYAEPPPDLMNEPLLLSNKETNRVLDDSMIPSAPPAIEDDHPDFSTLYPIPAPTAENEIRYNVEAIEQLKGDIPPSFEEFEKQKTERSISEAAENNEDFEFDIDGTEMTPEKRAEMILEQERILKAIKDEQEANDAAIAALTADEAEIGMSEEPKSKKAPSITFAPSLSRALLPPFKPIQTIEIAPNKKVALYGQDRTKEAIAKVSPVDHGSAVLLEEEAQRLIMDRKLAEKMQNDEYALEEKIRNENNKRKSSASIFGGSAKESHDANAREGPKQSWGEYFNSLLSTSDTTSTEDEAFKKRSAEIVVGQKRQLTPANIEANGLEDVTFRFKDREDKQSSLLPALDAEEKPLFSCVVDSVSTLLSTATNGKPDEVHGIDTSSLLTVTDVGRDGNDGKGY